METVSETEKRDELGFSVKIFVPAGDPEGIRVIEKSNWSGKGIVFPRSLFTEVRGAERNSNALACMSFGRPADQSNCRAPMWVRLLYCCHG